MALGRGLDGDSSRVLTASVENRPSLVREAERGLAVTLDDPEEAPASWRVTHTLYLVHYPAARVYGVASGSTDDTARKIKAARGEIVDTLAVKNKHAARLAKAAVLEQVQDARCIPPRSLVPAGRTETWRQDAGPVRLSKVVERRLRQPSRVSKKPGTAKA